MKKIEEQAKKMDAKIVNVSGEMNKKIDASSDSVKKIVEGAIAA